MTEVTEGRTDCEFLVVGSGAGGGTVAARLAESGRRVILLEAGGDPRELAGGDFIDPGTNRLPADYDVPAFHGFASENEAMRWDFFVRHYSDPAVQRLDPNYRPSSDGVLYPRSAGLGGCTSHNAMIFVYPQNADWDYIAGLTGDDSWRAGRMRTYFERLERCRHRPLARWLARLGYNPSRHGWKGWLSTEKSIPDAMLGKFDERPLRESIADAAAEAFREDGHPIEHLRWFFESGLDPNDWRLVRDNSIGIRYLPLTTDNHARSGVRERVLDVARRYPDRLRIVTNALATRVLFGEKAAGGKPRAIGVEYLKGERLYRAHPNPSREPGEPAMVSASCEVILAGGAFNTPQLLMLSGIGPRDTLRRHGISVLRDLPGVGRNLQDRYEVAVVNRMNFDEWPAYAGAQFAPGDPQYREWSEKRTGIYATNGSVLTMFRRSPVAGEVPDLFCMSVLSRFSGYFPGYSRILAEKRNYLTWVVLKAHTRNRAGEVTLASADPRDKPAIDFNYFQDGGDEDLTAVVDGIRFARRLSAKLKSQGLIEDLPGAHLQSEHELKEFVRTHAWGHHASCTCAIGSEETNGVLSSDFRVHGTTALRVVDASVFPRIPGFFVASAICMIGEKAADVLLSEWRK